MASPLMGGASKKKVPGMKAPGSVMGQTGRPTGVPGGGGSMPPLPPFPTSSAGGSTAQQEAEAAAAAAGIPVANPNTGKVAPVGAGGGGGAAGGPGGSTNTAQVSPYIKEQIDRYRSRFDKDTTARAIDRSNLGIADSAALMASDAKANMARRGVLGSGTGAAFLNKNVFAPAQRQAAGAAADISLGRERDLDALTLGGTGLMTAPSSIALADRDLALRQWMAQNEDERARAALAQAGQNQQLAQWIALNQLGGA